VLRTCSILGLRHAGLAAVFPVHVLTAFQIVCLGRARTWVRVASLDELTDADSDFAAPI